MSVAEAGSLDALRRELAAARADVQAATDAAILARTLRLFRPELADEARACEQIAATQAAALRRVRRIRHQLRQMGATP